VTPNGPTVQELGYRAKEASFSLALASATQKNMVLRAAGEKLLSGTEEILAANRVDLARGESEGVSLNLLDRLRLDPRRIESMAASLSQIAELPDPVGEVSESWVRPNGLRISKIRVPLGVVAIIYEMRPNVTSDAFGLCLKSGNAAFLRGSSAALESNRAVVSVIREAVIQTDLSEDSLLLVEDASREAAVEFMRLRGSVDCLIPRGGPSLISSVLEHATVPYIIDGDGNCHIYVDAAADLGMAVAILQNAKIQRPSVCNAAESLVIHTDVAEEFIPMAVDALQGVEFRGDERSCSIDSTITPAEESDYSTEYLDLKLSVCVVPDLDEAIRHVNKTGSGHSEAIVTSDTIAAERFCAGVDAAAVLVNASTRFIDGEEFGFGAEIGISTQKLHARGPMGLRELTAEKYVVHGDGHVRS